jgi:uncharacterized protein YgbK (DUF1537 family)
MNKTTLAALSQNLPLEIDQDLFHIIQKYAHKNKVTTIVLDDDPTGTQTVHDTPVYTIWSTELIKEELSKKTPLFYILTNSRSLQEQEAVQLNHEVGNMIYEASLSVKRKVRIISRSDSTLRGHYPAEVIALKRSLHLQKATDVLIPAFYQGGRYTVNDIHYVEDNDRLIPAADTPFAADNTFGYKSSNLKDWIVEKTAGRIKSFEIGSIPLHAIRKMDMDSIESTLMEERYKTIIINAISKKDLEAVAIALLKVEEAGKSFMYRTAASIVPVISGLGPKKMLEAEDLEVSKNRGGLIVVGSYVPKTTTQLRYLLDHYDPISIEVSVTEILESADRTEKDMETSKRISQYIHSGKHVVLFTSRKLETGKDKVDSLKINNKVAASINRIVSHIHKQPGFIIAKGGITSSDVASVCCNVRRALVMGQILAGVPVWKLDGKWEGLTYVVFPGNVGGESSLGDAFCKLAERTLIQ